MVSAVGAVSAAVLLFICISILWGLAEALLVLRIKHHQISSFGITAVWLTDFHCRFWFPPKRIARIAGKVNRMNPDLVLLGGDYVDMDSSYAASAIRELGKLRAEYGVYAVLGNHDVRRHKQHDIREELIEAMSETGIQLLYNAESVVDADGLGIRIIGTGDVREDVAYIHHLAPFLPSSETGKLTILMTHNPDFISFLDDEDVFDIILCGHTHGGQITWFGRPVITHTALGRRAGKGLIQYGKKTVLISNGLGTNILPFRIGAPPTIEVVHL